MPWRDFATLGDKLEDSVYLDYQTSGEDCSGDDLVLVWEVC